MTTTSQPAGPMHADELRAIRAQLGWRQADMAGALAMSLRQYKRLEAGESPIIPLRAQEARRLARQ